MWLPESPETSILPRPITSKIFIFAHNNPSSVMLKKLFCLVVAAVLLASTTAAAQNSVQRYVDSTMKATPQLRNAAVAILALDGRGKTIAAYNPDLPLLSASTMKTITTAVALDASTPRSMAV